MLLLNIVFTCKIAHICVFESAVSNHDLQWPNIVGPCQQDLIFSNPESLCIMLLYLWGDTASGVDALLLYKFYLKEIDSTSNRVINCSIHLPMSPCGAKV